jgi:hypothetical protein
MKKVVIALFVVMLLAACAPAAGQVTQAPEAAPVLLVTVGDSQHSLSMEDLQALPSVESSFKGVAYKGVSLSALLDAAGVSLDGIKAIKAVATDGFTVNYDTTQIIKDNVIMAYALADGSPLGADDGNFRLVLPDEEGKLNLRMLAELIIVQ